MMGPARTDTNSRGGGTVRWTMVVLWAAGCGSPDLGPWVPADDTLVGVYVDVEVSGQVVHCLVDTGAAINVLRTDPEGAIAAEARTARLSSMESRSTFYAHPDYDAVLDGIQIAGAQVDCILGRPALWDHALTVDYAGHRVSVSESGVDPVNDDTDPVEIPVAIVHDQWLVDAEISGVPMSLVLDTGATMTRIQRDTFDTIPDSPETEPGSVITPGGVEEVLYGTLDRLGLGEHTFEAVQFVTWTSPVTEEERAMGIPVDGLVGNSVFARGVTTIDPEAGVLRLEPYSAEVQASHEVELAGE